MTIEAALQKNQVPKDEHGVRDLISGNICRCTGYQNIVDAVLELSR